jgi:hypothetical protein
VAFYFYKFIKRVLVKETSHTNMKIHYTEIVTPEIEAVCNTYAKTHELTFGESDANLGGARFLGSEKEVLKA